MQPSLLIAQFPDKLAVEMPGAVKAMKFPVHLPDFRVDSSVAVIKPLYATLRHVRKLTLLPARCFRG
jgi:hypothetical protein